MEMPKQFKFVAAALAIYLAISLLVPKLMSIKGTNYWILAGGLALIGILAAVAYLWTEARAVAQAAKALAGPGAGGSTDELSQLLNEAEERLRSSNLGRGARFGSLPALFVIGPRGSTKTTTIVQSGLDPELLAGQVYQEGNVVGPTRFVNAWFARQWVFVEAGAAALADASQWSKLIHRMRPGQMQAADRKGAQSPRAALVCFDCEEFLKARGAESTAAAARDLHDKLAAISQNLGISLPVYVLFTKTDRIPYFHDYFQTLGNDESAQVLGATLPAGIGSGAYDADQSARLNAAMDQLYFSLAEHRIDFLAREGDAQRVPGAYEFPREFRKIRNLLVQFLLDVCRPSQLNATPFLRGFYFSGVRPILVRDAAPAPVVAKRSLAGDSGATGVFRVGPEPTGSLQAEGPAVRKVPQWVFLKQLFGQVVLADDAALGVSAVSVKTSTLKRALLASAAALGLLLSAAWIVSYSQNSDLEAAARDAAAKVKIDNATTPPLPSLDDLTKLDALRQSVETIGRYNREGPPLSYRWGLYVGEKIYPTVRRLYFARFFQLLFGATQARLVSTLKSFPSRPGPTDTYQYPYDTLKSYLITTSNHDKSTKLYLSPLLYSRWEMGKNADAAHAQLVRRQFDFYSEELTFENPYTSENDAGAIDRARKYLAQFEGPERVYRFMLAEVNKNAPTLNFNQKFPDSKQTVLNNLDVAGAFTKTGWPVMQDAIKHADKYFNGEQWVLGDQSANVGDLAKVESDIHDRYSSDYVDQWRDYLKKSVVVGYSDIPDAAKKLAMTAGPQSPLLEMFCMASQNVGVDPDIAKSFKAVLTVVPASCGDTYVGGANKDYMNALVTLQASLGQISSPNPDPNDPNVAAAANNAQLATVAANQMAQGFGADPLAPTVQKLSVDPIENVQPKLKGLGAADLNKGGKSLCTDFKALMSKYPFNPQSTNEALLSDVNMIFKPMEGSLWKFYDQKLQKLLPKQGNQYVPVSGGTITLLPAFVNFFNRLAGFSNAVYANGPDPHLMYSLKPAPSDIQSVTLTIDGVTLTSNGGNGAAKQFTWPGNQSGVLATRKSDGQDVQWSIYQGLWGVFKFFAQADKPAGPGSNSTLEWLMRTGTQISIVNGKPQTIRFDLDMGGTPPVFQKGYFSSWSCVADVAK
jgi:type VI secretion system protein ImpL